MSLQAICASFKFEIQEGYHDFRVDTFKAALYSVGATLGFATTDYPTAAGEVTGLNYPPGGVVVPNANPPLVLGRVSYWTPSSGIVFPAMTIGSPFDTMFIYNASKGGRGVGVWTFTPSTLANASATFLMPANTPTTALVQYP